MIMIGLSSERYAEVTKPFPKQPLVFMCLLYKPIENAVTNNFSFSHCFYLIGDFSVIFIKSRIVTLNLFFIFKESKICHSEKG